jgi:hypothetical protein
MSGTILDLPFALARSNESAPSSPSQIIDIIVVLSSGIIGAAAGAIFGYKLANRSQLKSKRIHDFDKKAGVYLDMIRNIDEMLHNREFLMLVEDQDKIYKTIKKIGTNRSSISTSEFKEYESFVISLTDIL